ncbi:hypothetical protein [Actinoplanes sp. HUAS TT8]|uniref:hypothetical protein n=1 Tax=Actinoplanes sp. HUAS TT8 TaxID=3447453 RepID=UPI003F51FE5F
MSEPHPQEPFWSRPGGAWSSGTVTGIPAPPAPATIPPEPPRRSAAEVRRRQLLIFGGVAGTILAGGLIVLLVLIFGSEDNPFGGKASGPSDVRPPLAQACPAPSDSPSAGVTKAPPSPPAVTGDRTVDEESGISYKRFGPPWQTWTEVWRAGTLKVPYKVGQHFVTETYSGGEYHASILSAAVPAADNDAVSLDLECVGRQITADVRANYYPQPNTLDPIRDEVTTLGGRPAYVSEFRLHFAEAGLRAKSELSAVAVIDVGKPTAAVLYVSIPGTHPQFDRVIGEVLDSVRML